MGSNPANVKRDHSLANACRQAGITWHEYLALARRFPIMDSESERIQRELESDSGKESAYLSAIRWAQSMPQGEARPAVSPLPRVEVEMPTGVARSSGRRIAQTLLVLGLLMADVAAIVVVVTPGGFKFFGLVLAGLASATIGGLWLSQRFRA